MICLLASLPEKKFGIFLLKKDSSVAHQTSIVINGDFAGWESDGDHMVFLRRHGDGFQSYLHPGERKL